jgi:hypothetical protein
MGDVWLWVRPRYRVAALVVVGAVGATWANGARLVAAFVPFQLELVPAA